MCRNGWAFKFKFCFLNCVICCVVMWLWLLLKIEIAMHIHSFIFHNEQQKNQDISPCSTTADYYWTRTIAPSNKPSFTHVSLQILCSRNGSLPKSISPNHMKTSPIKAVIRLMLNTTRQYAIDITFVITLTCFHNPVITNRFHNVTTENGAQHMHTHYSELH